MTRSLIPTRILLLLATLFVANAGNAAPPEPDAAKHFIEKVQPIFSRRCVKCHGVKEQESGLRLDIAERMFRGGQSGKVVKAGDPDSSLLYKLVSQQDGSRMPPDKPLSAKEIAIIKQWIRQGAIWPKHLSKIKDTSSAESK